MCTLSYYHHQTGSMHYYDVIMGAMASQITSLTIVYLTCYSGADQRKHQSSESLALCAGIAPGPVNSPHKWPVTRKMFPFDYVIMGSLTNVYEKQYVSYVLMSVWTGRFQGLLFCWLVNSLRSTHDVLLVDIIIWYLRISYSKKYIS